MNASDSDKSWELSREFDRSNEIQFDFISGYRTADTRVIEDILY